MSIPIGDGQTSEAEFIGLVPPGQTVQRPAPKEWTASYFCPKPVKIEFFDISGSTGPATNRASSPVVSTAAMPRSS